MSISTQFRLRLGCQTGADPGGQSLENILTGKGPAIWRGNDLRVEVGLLESDGATVITDISELATLTVEVFSSQAAGATLLASGTVNAAAMQQVLTQENWDAGTDQHAAITFTNLETAWSLSGATSKKFWLTVSAITNHNPARRITLYGGPLTVYEDVTPSDGPEVLGGNLVPAGALYAGADEYVLSGLTVGRTYQLTMGDNDTQMANGAQTFSGSCVFIATDTTVTFTGTAPMPVTAILKPLAYWTADESDARYQRLGGTEFDNFKLLDVATQTYKTVRINNGVLEIGDL